MNAFQVKCYLLPDNVVVSANTIGQANEIRRFALAGTPSGLYNQLVDKIQSAYGSLLPNRDEIKTYWQDEENDLVCFSTDSEIQYAIDLLTAIRMSTPYEKNSNVSSIFKVYITRKVNKTASEEKQDANTEEKLIHPGVVCDGCNGSVRGTRYNCTTCPDYDLCETCKDKGIHSEHEFVVLAKPGKGRCPHRRNRGFFGHGGWRRWQQNQQQGSCPSASRGPNPLQETLNNFIPFITNNIPIVNDPEQLKNVGEYLKQFLDPFGIDVDYHVDNNNTPCPKKKEKESEKEQEKAEQKTSEDVPKEDLLSSNKMEESKEKMDETSNETIIEPKRSSSIELIPLVRASSITTTPSAPNKDELIDLKSSISSKSPFESAANALKDVIEKKTDIEINKSEEREDSGFNLVDIEKELKYINCVEQLKTMGYNDDAGWLTRLVIAKDGNINLVLDSLQPK